jgi:hypothetical protein
MICPECLCDMIQDLLGEWFCTDCEEEDDDQPR